MCKTKDEASTKLDKLIATMERLAIAVEASNERNEPSIKLRFRDGGGEWFPVVVPDTVAENTPEIVERAVQQV